MELEQQHLDAITKTATVVANLAIDMREVKTNVKAVREAVNSHTNTLDGIAKNSDTWNIEQVIIRKRLDSHQKALEEISKKMGLQFEL